MHARGSLPIPIPIYTLGSLASFFRTAAAAGFFSPAPAPTLSLFRCLYTRGQAFFVARNELGIIFLLFRTCSENWFFCLAAGEGTAKVGLECALRGKNEIAFIRILWYLLFLAF